MSAAIIIDYATGITASYVKRRISSKVGFIGVLKKLCYYAVVAVSVILSYLLQVDVFNITIIFLIVNEIVSIIENLENIGVPIPPIIKKSLKKIEKDNSVMSYSDMSVIDENGVIEKVFKKVKAADNPAQMLEELSCE